MTEYLLPEKVAQVLTAAVSQNQRCVVMTCGMSGSGKSTLARNITQRYPTFVRFSIDQYVFDHKGVYGKDFPPEMYEEYLDEAEDALKQKLSGILEAGKEDAVLDYSFWSRARRDDYRNLISAHGAGAYQVVLVYFNTPEDVLWHRVKKREANRLAREDGMKGERDPGYLITRETFEGYLNGFQIPDGEGEIVVSITEK